MQILSKNPGSAVPLTPMDSGKGPAQTEHGQSRAAMTDAPPDDARTLNESPTRKPRVMIADDHRLIVSGLERLIASECEIVGTAYDTETLLTDAARLRPDMILLDLSMPPHDGLDVIRDLRRILHPATGIIVVTMNDDPAIAAEAFRAGASAYVLKNCAAQELIDAVHHVMDRQAYVTPLVVGGIIDSLLRPGQGRQTGDQLTHRQRDVLRLLAEGKSMKQVAQVLNLAVRTVAFHKYQMMKQLNIKTSAELVRFAVSQHIV